MNDLGKVFQVASFSRDITESKHAEEEKAQLEAQFHQAQKMESVGQLAGGVAHDFNNMLGVILGHAELAQNQLAPNHPLFNNLEEIRKAAKRSAQITRQLLAFARKQTVAPKVLDLNETVEGMLKMLRRLIGENINLIWMPESELWPVKMDPSQIDQILANLCVNARQAIGAGAGKITVETGNSTLDEEYCDTHAGFVSGDYVRIAVNDNGCGMERQILEHIFEPFFTTKQVGEGTGLGLATVYGAVKQNNGFIYAESEPGQGATFTIYLPRYQGVVGQVQTAEVTESALTGHETILLVEDELTILEMTTTMLGLLGHKVLAVGTAEEAIRLGAVHGGEIDLLLTDVIMPEMNGRDLAKRLLANQPEMRVLFMSGYAANILANQGVLDEGVHFIEKPFSMQELAAKVRQTLEN
jgi:nitrogen-specific signal transduction histidine kinase/CheY-like chemotaxis protein